MSGSSFFKSTGPRDPMSSIVRPNCSECGATGIEWLTPLTLFDRVPADRKPHVAEALEVLGDEGDAWLCPKCGGFGLLGPSETSL